jgi:hypothetical protein
VKDRLFFCTRGDIIFLTGGTKDQASPHRQVCPWTNSVVFTIVTPTSRSFEVRNLRFTFLPTIEVNHLQTKDELNINIPELSTQMARHVGYQ